MSILTNKTIELLILKLENRLIFIISCPEVKNLQNNWLETAHIWPSMHGWISVLQVISQQHTFTSEVRWPSNNRKCHYYNNKVSIRFSHIVSGMDHTLNKILNKRLSSKHYLFLFIDDGQMFGQHYERKVWPKMEHEGNFKEGT